MWNAGDEWRIGDQAEFGYRPYRRFYSGHSPGRAGDPAGCGHSKLARARTGLPLTSVQFMNDGSTSRKSVTKLFFAKASEAEIWTRIRRRYLTSFAGLHFENEPGLTELDAAEGRQNRRLCVSKRGNGRNTIAM